MMRFIYTVILLSGLFFIPFGSQASRLYFFSNFTVDDGLSDQNVNCFVKDADGFLWIGTSSGLNRFNGYDFTVYKGLAIDTTTLSSNYISHLFVDHAGQLWISTYLGLCRYEKKRNKFRRFSIITDDGRTIPSFECSLVFEDSKKNIWVGALGLGLLKYDPQQDCLVSAFPHQAGSDSITDFSKTGIISIVEDEEGTLWLSSFHSLLHYFPDKKMAREYKTRILHSDNRVFQAMKIFNDPHDKNILWLGSWGNGLVQFNKQNNEFTGFKFEENASVNLENIVFDIHPSDGNKLWLATNKGLVVFDTEKKTFDEFITDELNEKSIVNKQVTTIYRDRDGITWVGTVQGFCNFDPSKQNFVTNLVWEDVWVQKIYPDKTTGKIYGVRYYANRSLAIYDPKSKSRTVYKIPDADKLIAEPFSVIKDSRGTIWIGTTKGIYTFSEDIKKFKLFDIHTQLKIPDRSAFVNDIFEDSFGNIWFACYRNGLLKYDVKNKSLKTFFTKDGFGLLEVNQIIEGRGNKLYVSGNLQGIAKLDIEKNEFEIFNSSNKKFAVLYGSTGIALDKEQRIWVTTKNSGLVCIDKNNEVTAYIKDDSGNPIDELGSIVIDDSGKIWITSGNGLYRFDPLTKSFTQFTVQDGLPVRTISLPLYLMPDGRIAFIHLNRVFSFFPSQLSKRKYPLNVHLSSFFVNGKISSFSNIVDELDTIRLMHFENNLTFEFAALNFTNPTSTYYSYMLEGVDKNWSHPERNRSVNFSQLHPGNYLLRIRAGVYDVNDASGEKKIFFQVIPGWWQTAWFKWMLVITILVILYSITRFFLTLRFRQRIALLERHREIENIRSRISRDIHDEIGSGLTKIMLMSRNLSKKTEDSNAMKEVSTRISSASDELIQNLGEIVWTINPDNDTPENIFAFIRNYLSKLFEENPEMTLHLDLPDPEHIPSNISINPEVKRNMVLILKEAVTNIIKHARAKEVLVSISVDKLKLEMKIKDDGTGMRKENGKVSGNGIKNMRKRAEAMHAQLSVESSPGKGTGIHLLIPLHS